MASNEEILKRLNDIEKEVIKSREKNTSEHDNILGAAQDIKMLSDQISEVLDNFKGFANTLRFVRNTLITIAAIWLVFKEPLMNIIGG